MSKEYYVFQPNESGKATGCVNATNNPSYYPIVGKKRGILNPSAQQTEKWCDAYLTMKTGELAVERVPKVWLDLVDVPHSERDEFLHAFGDDIRTLSDGDFPQYDVITGEERQ
jgi:hypothetical protein